MGQLALGAVSASIVGGTASELTGGDFNNGALTAAYGYTSNYVAHAVFGGAILALVSSRDIGTPYTTTDELQLVFEDVTAFSSFPGSKKIANMCRIDGAKTTATNTSKATDAVSKWLGKGTQVKTNKAGDKIFISADGKRRFRVDIKNPHGDKPHMHLETKPNKRWHDATDKHRIYPKDQ